MMKSVIALALVATTGLTGPAMAAGVKSPGAMPSANHQSQWWTNAKGCTYSRAGRPGEVVWFLTNKPPRGTSCLEFFFQRKIDGGYKREPFMIKG